jgi:BNR repeat-containing family member/F5/8 type C domain
MSPRGRAPILLALLAGALVGVPASAAGQDVARIEDRILDPEAHARITYENTVNVASYQQDGILTYGGYQYTAWYENDGPGPAQATAVIARRALPDGDWESTRLDYTLFSNDSHNTIALGVTPTDGRIHIAFPTHANVIRYTRSIPGVASEPAAHEWSSLLFERTKSQIPGAPGAPPTYTYPQFELAGDDVLLTWRDGSSDNGRQALLRYDENALGTWSFLGRFTHNLGGTYNGGFGSSTSRYGYIHGFTADPASGELAITLSWREQTSAWCPGTEAVGNHDLGYAVSDDGGLTWRNNAGATVATTTTGDTVGTITPFSPGIVVEPIGINTGLINQETQAFDSEGQLHVVTSRVPDEDLGPDNCAGDFYPDRAALARPYHHWRDAAGTWQTTPLPFRSGSAGRTKIAFDSDDNAYVVLPDARIVAASAASGWTDWELVFEDPDVENVSELIVDRQLVPEEGILSVAYQEPPPDVPTCRTNASSTQCASAYRVASFELGSAAPDAPRATEPEAAPRPFEGTAEDASNLALNREGEGFPEAFADSNQAAFPASLANDGNLNTFWVSSGTQAGQGPTPESPIHLGVDLGRAHPLAEVTMIPRVSFGPRAYTVQVSADREDWNEVAAVPAAPNASVTTGFETIAARYVRLRITDAYDSVQPPRNVQVAELEVRAGPVPPAPALDPSVTPRRRTVKVGKPARFRFTVANAGDGPAQGLRLCVAAPKRKVRVLGAPCRAAPSLAAGASMTATFTLKPRRSARGRTLGLTFVATASNAPRRTTTATLKVRR